MKTLQVNIPAIQPKTYPIYIGSGILEKIETLIDFSKYSSVAIITDQIIAKHYLRKLEEAISLRHFAIILPSGENEKNIRTVEKIWTEMTKGNLDRKSLVINLGGGVIGDVGGFAASIYMRGIDFLNIPTTITAAVDANVGGKTGVNFRELKNYIGSFQQPIGVVIDVETFKTLPKRAYIEAFSEIIKHGLIADKTYFDFVTSKKSLEFTTDEMIEIIEGSLMIKNKVVESDEKENGVRKVLNFGHTIGHAIEAISLSTKTPLMHGEAVSIGMVAEAKLSELKNFISSQDLKLIETSLQHAGLPIRIQGITEKQILQKIAGDKKNEFGKIKWTLLKKIGKAVYNEEVDEALVVTAIQKILE